MDQTMSVISHSLDNKDIVCDIEKKYLRMFNDYFNAKYFNCI